jgi:hypothetical protein
LLVSPSVTASCLVKLRCEKPTVDEKMKIDNKKNLHIKNDFNFEEKLLHTILPLQCKHIDSRKEIRFGRTLWQYEYPVWEDGDYAQNI